MKNTKKGRIASLGLALFMGVSSVFGTSVLAVSAQESELSNEEKAREIVSQMSLEEKIGQKLMLFPKRLDHAGWHEHFRGHEDQ